MWYSVTPEALAKHTAARFPGKRVVVDAFAGAGGNAIQFAARRDIAFVLACECVPSRAQACRHNAAVYGVQARLDVLCADALTLPRTLRPGVADAVFLSPPWGGPRYKQLVPYPLTQVRPADGFQVFAAAAALAPSIAYYLPVHTDAACTRCCASPAGGNASSSLATCAASPSHSQSTLASFLLLLPQQQKQQPRTAATKKKRKKERTNERISKSSQSISKGLPLWVVDMAAL